MQKTRSEIMFETFEYYNNPKLRGLSESGHCLYLTKDGKMCAVGRCMINPGDDRFYSPNRSFTYSANDIYNLDSVLKEEYRGHKNDFWCALQDWHDSAKNFDSNGITQAGYDHIEFMTEKYSE